jgi:hypothetical protein
MFCSPQPSITNLVVCLKDMLGVEEASTTTLCRPLYALGLQACLYKPK